MSNRRSILYLLALLLLAVAANLWLDVTGPDHGEVVGRTSLFRTADAAVTLEILSPGRHSMRLEKSDRWRIVTPFRAVADQTAVARLTDAVAFAPLVSKFEEADAVNLGRSRSDFGLDRPRLVLTVTTPTETSEIRFGDDAPTGEGVYADVDRHSAIYIVPTETFEAANRSVDAWRRRTLFRVKPDEVTSIDIRRGESSIRLLRTGDNWEVDGEKKTPASAAAVKRIIDTVLSCEASTFVWPVGASNETVTASVSLLTGYGLDPETCETVVFRGDDGRDHSISFGSAAGTNTVYALVHGGNAVATVTAAAKASVSLDAGTLIDGRIFPFDKSAVQRISMVDGDTAYLLARGDTAQWRLDSPVSAAADETAVAALIDKLLVMRNVDLDENGVKVSLSSNTVPVAVARGALLGVGGFEQFRSKLILDIDSATVKRLVFTRNGAEDSEAVVFDPDRKGWNVDPSGRDGVIDSERLNAVLAALSPLKAASVARLKVVQNELSRYGLETPRYTIAVDRLLEDSVRRNILIGATVNADGDAYATVGSSDAVFVLDGETVDILTSGVFVE